MKRVLRYTKRGNGRRLATLQILIQQKGKYPD